MRLSITTKKIIRNFSHPTLIVINAILKIFNSGVLLPVKIYIVVAIYFKQHTLANAVNTNDYLLLILYFQPKKVTRDHNEDNVIVTTEIQTLALSFTFVQYAANIKVRNSSIPHFLLGIVNNCTIITTALRICKQC